MLPKYELFVRVCFPGKLPSGANGFFMPKPPLSAQKLQEQIRTLEELLEINLFLNSTLDLDLLLTLILEVSKKTLNVQAVSILLLEKKTGELFFRSAIGGSAGEVAPYRLRKGEGIAGAVVETRRAIVVDDAQADPRFAKRFDTASGFTTRSILAVPMWAKDEIMGVLELMNKKKLGGKIDPFGVDDQKKASVLANMAAVAIENAQLYQDLNQSYELIRKTEESKKEFISVISHELRTPLVPIQGYAFLLRKQRTKLDEKSQDEFLDDILRQSDHLKMLIEDLFLVNEFDLDPLSLQPIQIPVKKMVEEAVRIKKIDQKKHPVEVKISRGVKKDREPALVVDRDKFTHLLVHLLDNAAKFSPDGGKITVALEAENGKGVQLTVEDEGVGIPPEYREKIFSRFFQLDSSSTRRFGGTGVGLFIVRKVAEAHQGKVWCEKRDGKGTKFVVSLPRERLLFGPPSV